MEREELGRRLNAIAAYMGGPKYLKEKHFSHLMDVEFELIGLDDLRFHESWDWLIPVWSKLRMRLLPTAVISAIVYIDEDKISELFMLLSNNALVWCKEQNIQV
jgi:hypothetical protein